MKLSAPKNVTFVITIIIALVGVIGKVLGMIIPMEILNEYSLWVTVAGFIILMLGNMLKGF